MAALNEEKADRQRECLRLTSIVLRRSKRDNREKDRDRRISSRSLSMLRRTLEVPLELLSVPKGEKWGFGQERKKERESDWLRSVGNVSEGVRRLDVERRSDDDDVQDRTLSLDVLSKHGERNDEQRERERSSYEKSFERSVWQQLFQGFDSQMEIARGILPSGRNLGKEMLRSGRARIARTFNFLPESPWMLCGCSPCSSVFTLTMVEMSTSPLPVLSRRSTTFTSPVDVF